MTLIITELSEYGIILAGDTAYTIDSGTTIGTMEERAFKGLVKVIPVQQIGAGLSYWGWATMPPGNVNPGVWMDWWIRDFITRNGNRYSTINELATLLETELRRLVPPLTPEDSEILPLGNGGIHLSGFTEYQDELIPCFWHIHNGISTELPDSEIDPTIVNANYDCPPERYVDSINENQILLWRNGDIEPYARFFDRHLNNYVVELAREEEFIIPLPNMLSRAEYIRAQIRFISELYSVGGDLVREEGTIRPRVRSISDETTILMITNQGITNYFTR